MLSSARFSAHRESIRNSVVGLFAAAFLLAAMGCSGDTSSATATAGRSPASSTTSAAPSAAATTSTTPARKHFAAAATGLGKDLTLYGNDNVVVSASRGKFRTFKTDGTPLGTYTANDFVDTYCGIHVGTRPDSVHALYTVRSREIPAAGLQSAQISRNIAAWDATTFRKLWETEVVKEPTGGSGPCSLHDPVVYGTTDGKWLTAAISDTYVVLDSASGQLRKVDYYPVPVGVNIGTFNGMCANCINGLESVKIVDPATLAPVSEIAGRTPNIVTQDYDRPLGVLTTGVSSPERSAWFRDGIRIAVAHAGQVRILNLRTGEIERRLPLAGGDTMVSGSIQLDETQGLLLVHEQSIGSSRSTLHAFRLSDGTEAWSQPAIGSLCVVGGNQVNVIANGQMVLLDEASGKQSDYTSQLSSCGDVFGLYSFNGNGSVYRLVD